ncbi:SIR2 family protein [Sulfitobacter sp. CW3]|uniref:SIR2 family protein n=1 Tax=Sulfitobacter sp. CW3 TaxID=2861965 RepID=UPI001C604732|nr:SIR2 family protein [Sulfitobacter sp. CW3]MBW4964061.1 SIR2 family protein [Sulfitobacter sp. CW3]
MDANGPVVLGGNEYDSSEVFKVYAPHDYDANFTEWLADHKTIVRLRVAEELARNGCQPRFNRLAERQRSQQILPFVGAGLSRPSGFVMWRQFIEEVAQIDPALLLTVQQRMDAGDYEGAAQCICDAQNENRLAEQIENYFDRQFFEVRGPVKLLPLLFSLGCVTTNFDAVLEKSYEEHGLEFVTSYAGQQVLEAPRNSANTQHALFKLHGHANSANGRILTAREYDHAYGNDRALPGMIAYLAANRSFLFLGSSLSVDRTIRALQQIKANAPLNFSRHYAFLQDPGEGYREARAAELEQAEIYPIWYPVDDHDVDHDRWIEDYLVALEGGPL